MKLKRIYVIAIVFLILCTPVLANDVPLPDKSWSPPSKEPSVESGESSELPNVMYKIGGGGGSNVLFYVQYGSTWDTQSAVYLQDSVKTAVYNDQPQNLYWVEVYPDGNIKTWNMGYHGQGWITNWKFVGDTVGWHKIYIYGTASGYSDPIWVYVWPNNPQSSTLILNAWMTQTTYSPGQSIDVGYYVNMPANVKITAYTPYGTYVKTYYANTGIHYVHLGVAGSTAGWRQVKVEAWANGQYKATWLSFNVITQASQQPLPPIP